MRQRAAARRRQWQRSPANVHVGHCAHLQRLQLLPELLNLLCRHGAAVALRHLICGAGGELAGGAKALSLLAHSASKVMMS